MLQFKFKCPFSVFIVANTLFFTLVLLVPNYRHFPFNNVNELLLIVIHCGLSAFGLLAVLSVLSLNKYLYAIFLPFLAIVAATTAFFVWQIDVSINSALIESILHTNANEAADVITPLLIVYVLIIFIFSVLSVFWRFGLKLKKRGFICLAFCVVVGAAVFSTTEFVRPQTLLARNPFSFYVATKDFLNDQREMSAERLMVGSGAVCTEDSLITILIIGESLRADHLQMNGYHRTTMPYMEERAVFSLPHVFSPYTHTSMSINYFLTRAEEGSLEPIENESSFIDLFNESGFYSAWIANQNPIAPFRFFINESDTVYINKPHLSDYSNTTKYDLDLFSPFKDIIGLNYPKTFVVLHLHGNHWWYNSNLPPDFVHFTPILDSKRLSTDNRERMINSYDNVTLATDYLIEQLLKEVEDKKVLLIFLSDHGESFGEEGKWLHANNMPAEQNPACFIWLSESYKNKFPEMVTALQQNYKKEIDTSFLFHTITNGSKIESHYIDNRLNLFFNRAAQ